MKTRSYTGGSFFIAKLLKKMEELFMERTMISELKNSINKEVSISGYVHRVRILKSITFIIIRDRTGLVQCVADKGILCSTELKNESVVEIAGLVKEGHNAISNFELQVKSISILSTPIEEVPLEVNKENLEVSLETMLNNRVVSLRHPKKNAIFKVSHIVAESFREFLTKEGFTEIFTPKIVSEGAEGGTELFKVQYFEKEAYLAQSPQFYKQMMVAAGYERVFEIGNFFRAEEHNTRRHLNQFTSMDLEMGFIKDENDVMDMEEAYLAYMIKKLNDGAKRYFELLNSEIPSINGPIPRLELKAVHKILKDNYGKVCEAGDMDSEGERLISEYAKKEYNTDFILITRYSRKKRPMYTMPYGEDETRSFDLIFRGCEITSGAQRIHDYNMLKESFISKGLNPLEFPSYLEAFKYGMPPHGGLAIGLERLTALLLSLDNVREASIFPRDRTRLVP